MPVPAQGNVVTPTGFLVVSQQGQVGLTWNNTPGATLYYINRSTDNTTFTNIGNTTNFAFQDTTALAGTIYFYTLQAATSTASSVPTPSQQGQALNAGQTTLANVRLQCKQRCDRVNSEFVTDQEWNTMIDESYKELYDLLVQKFGDDYFIAPPFTFLTTNSQTYPLPDGSTPSAGQQTNAPAFYKLMGVEVQLNTGDPNSFVTLRKFEFIQRNLWNFPNVYTMYGITNLRYRLSGNNIMLVPVPSNGQIIRLWYNPRPNQLINDTDTLDMVSGWEEYIVVDACIKAMIKEESDISGFAAQKQNVVKRIEEAAENRDVGEPETVSDSKRRNLAWSDDDGYGSGGTRGI